MPYFLEYFLPLNSFWRKKYFIRYKIKNFSNYLNFLQFTNSKRIVTPETFTFVKNFQIKMNIIITDCLFCSVGALNDCSQRFFLNKQALCCLSVPLFQNQRITLNFVTNYWDFKQNQNIKRHCFWYDLKVESWIRPLRNH